MATAIYNQLPDEARTSPDTKWETEHTQEWDNAFDLMAQLHPSLYQTAGKVQYPMKNAGSLDLLATQQIDMTPPPLCEHGAEPEKHGHPARLHQAAGH